MTHHRVPPASGETARPGHVGDPLPAATHTATGLSKRRGRPPHGMLAYGIFGKTLITDIPFPELGEADPAQAAWIIRTRSGRPPSPPWEPLAHDEVDTGVQVRLWGGRDDLFLTYDDTGTFAVSPDGCDIRWWPGTGASAESVRLDVVGRVLPLALQRQGFLSLHGSAVSLAGRAVAFIAPKHHGKSTLAQALVAAGGRLITDDVLPIDHHHPVQALPGTPRVRLRADSARIMGAGTDGDETMGKVSVEAPATRVETGALPLAAIYLLNPVEPDRAGPAATRAPVSQVQGALSLVRHAKLGPLLAGHAATDVLRQAVSIVGRVPVYRLDVVRDFGRLAGVVDLLLDWHSAGPGAPALGAPAGR